MFLVFLGARYYLDQYRCLPLGSLSHDGESGGINDNDEVEKTVTLTATASTAMSLYLRSCLCLGATYLQLQHRDIL
jgi:hypothetical protein